MKAALPVALLAGAGLRAWGLFTDLWLDEVWSVEGVRQAGTLSGLFTRFLSDNNHLLVSLWILPLRDQRNWIVFRLLPFAAGILGIAAAWGVATAVGRRWSWTTEITGAAENKGTSGAAGVTGNATGSVMGSVGNVTGSVTAILFAFSYPLVSYSSEARGYTLAVLFALLAFLALDRFRESERPAQAFLFAAFVVLGFLSQLLFIHAYAGLVAFSLIPKPGNRTGDEKPRSSKLSTSESRLRPSMGSLALLHAVPILFLAALYLGFVRRLHIGQGPITAPLDIAGQAASLALGLPEFAPWTFLASILVTLISFTEIRRLRREGDASWVFFVVSIFLSPLALFLVSPYSFFQPRYLILSIAFFLLLLGRLLDRLFQAEGSRINAIAALSLLVVLGIGQTVTAFRVGRGRYREAITRAASESPPGRVSIGGDEDFRNFMLVHFYADYAPFNRTIAYVGSADWPPAGTDWFIRNLDPAERPAAPSINQKGVRYRLDKEYPYRGLSGTWWALYRRE